MWHLNEQQLRRLQVLLQDVLLFLQKLRERFFQITVYDYQWIPIIFFLALLLRLPFLSYPAETQFDEVIITNFVLHILNAQPFFDIHPPLVRMLFTEIAQPYMPLHVSSLPMQAGQTFADFPYVAVRSFVALTGALLPLVIYLIGRLLRYTPRTAALPALFVVFDSALIIYSRTILPDMILLLCNFLAFAFAFAFLSVRSRPIAFGLLVCTGIAAGLALSIKWLALAVLATIWLLFFWARRYSAIITTGAIALLVYCAVFASFFLYFPQGGKSDFMLFSFNTSWVRDIEFPKGTSLTDVASFLPEFHHVMLRANQDEGVSQVILQAPGPLAWAAGRSAIDFWIGPDGKKIVFQANALLWSLAFLLFLFEIAWICGMLKKHRAWPIDRDETVLLAGYVMNYLPFFLISRPMYLYHYFTALILLFLLVPKIAPRMIHCIAILTSDRLFALTFAYFTLFLCLVNFFLLLPSTYGF